MNLNAKIDKNMQINKFFCSFLQFGQKTRNGMLSRVSRFL